MAEDQEEDYLSLMVGGRAREEEARSEERLDASSKEEDESVEEGTDSNESDEIFFLLSENHFHSELENDSNEEEDLPADVSSIQKQIKKRIKVIRAFNELTLNEEQKKHHITKLCNLRIRLAQIMEQQQQQQPNTSSEQECWFLNGHKFSLQSNSNTKRCDVCLGRSLLPQNLPKMFLFNVVINPLVTCIHCSFGIHKKCLISALGHPDHHHESYFSATFMLRKCPSSLSSTSDVILKICPEVGLFAQSFRCYDCKEIITSTDTSRLDDYDGRWYCAKCHWNDVHPVPARIIHNWDPSPVPVSRSSLQFLTYIGAHELFDLMQLNSMLFGLVPDLALMKRIRGEVAQLTTYIRSCLYHVKPNLSGYQPHLLSAEQINFYTLNDLIGFKELCIKLTALKEELTQHVTVTCEGCRGKGHFCGHCNDKRDLLFPFSLNISICGICCSVYHKSCFTRKGKTCIKCINGERRRSSQVSNDHDVNKEEE